MGVPTSEVGYTAAMPSREDHEVHKDMWWHWTHKNRRYNYNYYKIFKIYKYMFRMTRNPPSGNFIQCVAKISCIKLPDDPKHVGTILNIL